MIDIKNDILSRALISFILIIIAAVFIMGKAFKIQQKQGAYWRNLNETLHVKTEEVLAERGTIYSEDEKMLCTSIPQFDIYVDFAAEGLRAKKGILFFDNLDSLSLQLSNLFGDYSYGEYKKILKKGYASMDRYYPLQKKVSYEQYIQLKKFPLIRLGKNKSGFVIEVKNKRLNPYGILAFRTIGLARDSFKVGLELSYDSLLRGVSGTRTVRYIAGGVPVPLDEAVRTETQNGKDIVTTLDVLTQEITENALMNMMVKNQAQHGCAIVMETKTGKIKAIANLGFDERTGNYYENKNYALYATEPGSTFKLATMLALLDDGKINLNSTVDLQKGSWAFAKNATVFDAEIHGRNFVTAQEAFELSSNVGMAKLIWNSYATNPYQYINKLHLLKLDTLTGIDLVGERSPIFHKPGTRGWERTTLPWMAHGYNVSVTPLQTLMLYNAVANKGKMMKPYLVSSIRNQGLTEKEFTPTIINEKICSESTLAALTKCLIGVCHSNEGTARKLFKDNTFLVAGKTGTSFVVDDVKKYSDKIYQSSFAGFFPADNPQYTCVVVIVNKQNALMHYGAEVAGPVFKEIANRLFTLYVKTNTSENYVSNRADTDDYKFIGYHDDLKYLFRNVGLRFKENSSNANDWVEVNGTIKNVTIQPKNIDQKQVPSFKGLNARDAIFMGEELGLKVNIVGKGKVVNQSIIEGTSLTYGKLINLELF